ncbi:trigger factor [Propionibacterium australiense]|uniref:Trigger factor n=1 Tax=Propionibacterium australiense TaxID=119981 RepID=A0A8B3FUV3_9ACTN|nr:trigger factor [Propionibacterium australiense]RLP11022.1 trigger factor [Propionibacterium australiense]RLP13012.1 trigger factor [Propionibacterium australiense]VEH91011.1 Trigger factor [Propionibacterium australiense]
MPSTVEQLNPTRVKLTIELPFSDLQPRIDEAYKQIAQQINLPGFRRGKVPPRLIDQRFGRGTVLQEAVNNAIPEAYSDAVTEHKITPLGNPEIELTRLEDGDVAEITAEVDVRPEFDMPDFSQISVEVDSLEVSDADVDERVELLRQRFGTLKVVDRAAADGDVVLIDLVATQDGEAIEDAETSGMQYRIGAGGMVEGLDEALIGLKAGESKAFTSALVGGPHRDEEADITVTVTKVNEQELPELDDEFAQLVSEFDTVDEMIADVRENLERIGRLDQANTARDKVLEAVVGELDFELPQAVLDNEIEAYHEQIEAQLNAAGLTVEQYLADAEDEDAETAEEFWKQIDERAERGMRAQIVLDKLAEDRQIGVSQEEFTQLIFQKAQQNGTSPEQEIQHMTEHNHMLEWMAEVRRGKALGMIVDEASVTDTNGDRVEISRLQNDGSLAPEAVDEADAEQPQEDETAAEQAEQEADGEA